MKSILNEWRKYNSTLNEMSRVWTQDAVEFEEESLHKAAASQSQDKTKLKFPAFIKEIVNLVESNKGKNLFVSFVDRYDFETPALGVSPEIKYATPHGIYGYPLNEETVFKLLTTGDPTGAEFAVDRSFMHVYSLSSLGGVKLEKDYTTNYDDSKFNSDLNTITKMTLDYVTRIIDKEKMLNTIHPVIEEQGLAPKGDFKKFIENPNASIIPNLGGRHPLFLGAFIYNNYVRQRKSSREIAEDLKAIAVDLAESSHNIFQDRIDASKFYLLYYIARLYSMTCNHMAGYNPKEKNIEAVPEGGMFTILLDGIGISSINDAEGTSLLHHAEPSQAVALDTKKSEGESVSYNLIGTYRSPAYYFELYPTRRQQAVTIIDKLLETGEISIDTVYPKGLETEASIAAKHAEAKYELDVKKAVVNLEALAYEEKDRVTNALWKTKEFDSKAIELLISEIEMAKEVLDVDFESYETQIENEMDISKDKLKELGFDIQSLYYIYAKSIQSLFKNAKFVSDRVKNNEHRENSKLLLDKVLELFVHDKDDAFGKDLIANYSVILKNYLNESRKTNSNILKEYIKAMLM